jgi:PAS domain S-box-containing protein
MVLSFEEYRTLVEQAPILVWRANPAAQCDYFNERWLAFRGRSMEEEVGNGWVEGVHPDDRERCIATFLSAFDRRHAFEMEYRLLRQDGAYRWIFDRGVPFCAGGQFEGYIGSCVDVTERVEAQEALRQARERELNDLRGLLPICSACKRIRDDSGYWERLETYIREHSKAEFTHGICPECLDRLYCAAGVHPDPGGPRLAAPGGSAVPKMARRTVKVEPQSAAILVVDDEDSMRKLIRRLLEASGHRVVEAENGKVALSRIAESKLHLVLTDLCMPEQEGLETIKVVRQRYPSLKIIAMSGAHNGTFLRMAKLMGAHSVIEKPFTAADLEGAIRQALASGQADSRR